MQVTYIKQHSNTQWFKMHYVGMQMFSHFKNSFCNKNMQCKIKQYQFRNLSIFRNHSKNTKSTKIFLFFFGFSGFFGIQISRKHPKIMKASKTLAECLPSLQRQTKVHPKSLCRLIGCTSINANQSPMVQNVLIGLQRHTSQIEPFRRSHCSELLLLSFNSDTCCKIY